MGTKRCLCRQSEDQDSCWQGRRWSEGGCSRTWRCTPPPTSLSPWQCRESGRSPWRTGRSGPPWWRLWWSCRCLWWRQRRWCSSARCWSWGRRRWRRRRPRWGEQTSFWFLCLLWLLGKWRERVGGWFYSTVLHIFPPGRLFELTWKEAAARVIKINRVWTGWRSLYVYLWNMCKIDNVTFQNESWYVILKPI